MCEKLLVNLKAVNRINVYLYLNALCISIRRLEVRVFYNIDNIKCKYKISQPKRNGSQNPKSDLLFTEVLTFFPPPKLVPKDHLSRNNCALSVTFSLLLFSYSF